MYIFFPFFTVHERFFVQLSNFFFGQLLVYYCLVTTMYWSTDWCMCICVCVGGGYGRGVKYFLVTLSHNQYNVRFLFYFNKIQKKIYIPYIIFNQDTLSQDNTQILYIYIFNNALINHGLQEPTSAGTPHSPRLMR